MTTTQSWTVSQGKLRVIVADVILHEFVGLMRLRKILRRSGLKTFFGRPIPSLYNVPSKRYPTT